MTRRFMDEAFALGMSPAATAVIMSVPPHRDGRRFLAARHAHHGAGLHGVYGIAHGSGALGAGHLARGVLWRERHRAALEARYVTAGHEAAGALGRAVQRLLEEAFLLF